MSFQFRLGGCQVEAGVSCFMLGAFACLFMGRQAPAVLSAMALHEGGHLLAMAAFGAAPRRIALSALGCRMVLPEGAGLKGLEGAAVSLAGPGANLLSFLFCLPARCQASPFALASLSLGALHLLPIEPLDGGLALRRLLETRLSLGKAALTCRLVSAGLLLPLWVLGFWILLRTRYNYTLLALAMYLMLYLVLGKDYGDP